MNHMRNHNITRRLPNLMLKKKPHVQDEPQKPITPIRVIDANPEFPEDSLAKIPFLTARDFLKTRPPTGSFLIKDLVPKHGNVLFRIDPEVDAQMFAVELGAAVAAGQPFLPYSCSMSATTTMIFNSGGIQRIHEQVQLCMSRFGAISRNNALARFHLYHPKNEGKQIEYLNSRYAQAELLNSLPDNCGLLIVFDCAGMLATKSKRDILSYQHFASYLKKLNSQGIATAVFFQSARKAYAGYEDDLIMDAWHNVIDLSPWAGAPREFGGGFTVSQQKVSEFSTIPTRYHYWYTVIDGKLESGFQCEDSNDPVTMKQIEITERQMRVKEMLARGIQHKTIAAQLGVDAATISRDAAKIKSEARATSRSALSELNDVGTD